MVNRDLLTLKLAELEDRVARVRTHAPESVEALKSDRDALDLVAFNLMLSVQSCTDIAVHIIADSGWPTARNLADAFVRLHERGVIAEPTALALSQAVGLRNVVAHGYARVDAAHIFAAATHGLADLERFAREVAVYAAAQA